MKRSQLGRSIELLDPFADRIDGNCREERCSLDVWFVGGRFRQFRTFTEVQDFLADPPFPLRRRTLREAA